jgi:hypothetical protein
MAQMKEEILASFQVGMLNLAIVKAGLEMTLVSSNSLPV